MKTHIYNDNTDPDTDALKDIAARADSARAQRGAWDTLWQDCYDCALPQRGGDAAPGRRRDGKIYDATAMDAADQLAASLLGHLTPAWSQWFGLRPGPDLDDSEAARIAPALERAARTLQTHFDHSNFGVEIHQCYLDLIVGGTACLSFEEDKPGAFSAFRFSAVPLAQIALGEGEGGLLDSAYRTLGLTAGHIHARYPDAVLPPKILAESFRDPDRLFDVIEAVEPDGAGSAYTALLLADAHDAPVPLAAGRFTPAPLIAFRWMKSPGEIYGRSPVMKALPDIKTANKVVELILKNASIAVTGIWQADDDGVLNPANIELVPGAIIPKAIGSQGLQPLGMPGDFDVSQLVLDNLRTRIRSAMLADRLLPEQGPRMTATEILQRAAENALLLGAVYGRLQTELLNPLIRRAWAILRRRGEVPDLELDGRLITIDYRAPLARAQAQRDVQSTLSWINAVLAMGPEAAAAVDLGNAARFLGDALGVPAQLIRNNEGEASHVQ